MRNVICSLVALLAALTPSVRADGLPLLRKRDRSGAQCLPDCPPVSPYAPLDPAKPLTPADQPPAQPTTPPFSEALASRGEFGTQPAASFRPGMFGDFIGGVVEAPVFFPGQSTTMIASIPDVTLSSAIKISESDSPRPLDRAYYLYNYYANIDGDPANPALPRMQLHRHVVGLEKTLFNGNASVGVRVPFFSLGGDPGYSSGYVGDLSVFTKYAVINNEETGNVVSVGLGVATPTGNSPNVLIDDTGTRARVTRSRAVTLQPYGGYLFNVLPRLYVHGFHAVLVPTEANLATFMTNDVGVGLWLYQNADDQFIRGIVPTVEVHVNTPFNRREPAGPPFGTVKVSMQDSVNLTSGCYILFPRSILGGAVGVPLTNYGPHAIEALASFTMRF